MVTCFFAFIFGGLLLEAFFGPSLGVTLDATALQIEGIATEFLASVVIALASLFLSTKKYGRSLPNVILLGSTSLFAIVVFEIVSGMSFPTFMTNLSYALFLIMIASLVE